MPENTSSPSQKGRIFISYRRADSEGYAGRIYDRLAPHFGDDAIFMDVDDIPAGVDFVKYLENEVQSCDVLIALIGKQWLNMEDEHGLRRLDNPNDFVRIEIGTALKRDIRVIPVLLGGTQMPNVSDLPENLQSLTRRNGLLVYHHSFHADTNRLIKHLENALGAAEKATQEKAEKEAAEKARLKAEEEERQRIAKEKAEREAAEKATKKARLETEEKLRQKVAKEKVEREAAEKVAREKAEKEAAEKARLKAEEEERQRIAKEKASLEKELWLDRLYTEGLAAFYTEDWDKATQRFQTILKEQPDNKNVTKKLIEIERQKESAEKAAREKAEKEAAKKARLEAEEQARQKAVKEKAKSEAVESGRRSSGFSGIEIVVIVIVFGCVAAVLTLLFSSFEKPEVAVTPTTTIITPSTTLIPTKTKVPTSTLTLTPTFIPDSALLYSEDFENGVANDWVNTNGSWEVVKDESNNQVYRAVGPGSYSWSYLDPNLAGANDWTDYAFESRVRIVKGTIFVVARLTGTTTYFYVAVIGNDGVEFADWNITKDGWTGGNKANYSIQPNKWYTVRFELMGDSQSLYIDGKLILERKITGQDSGRIGFYIGDSPVEGENEEVYFDDIRVWSLK